MYLAPMEFKWLTCEIAKDRKFGTKGFLDGTLAFWLLYINVLDGAKNDYKDICIFYKDIIPSKTSMYNKPSTTCYFILFDYCYYIMHLIVPKACASTMYNTFVDNHLRHFVSIHCLFPPIVIQYILQNAIFLLHEFWSSLRLAHHTFV